MSHTTCWGDATAAIHAGRGGDAARPLVTPIVQSTTYVQERIGGAGHAYTRVSNPTVSALEEQLGALEGAPPAVCFGTGLGAETALLLALVSAGDHVVLGEAIYGGTVRLVREVLSRFGVTSSFVDTSKVERVEGAIQERTRLVFIETPANPTLTLTDVEAVAAVCRRAGVPLAVDNTFLTAILQKPLDLGAQVSVYSTTKHIEGHSTAIGGAIVSRDEGLLERVRYIRKCTGSIQAAFQAWLTSRGVATLPLRIRAHSQSAQRIAERLAGNPWVSNVNYPGLESHPQHALALRQHLGGHGGVISFEVAGGIEAGRRVLEGARLCQLVEHVGSVESLLTHPATMTHADVPREQRVRAGISDGLIRLSVGLEEPEDIIADLEGAIERAHRRAGVEREVAPCAAR